MKLTIESVPNCFAEAGECLSPFKNPTQNKVYININKMLSYNGWASSLAEQLREELNEILHDDTDVEHSYNPNSSKQTLAKLVELYNIPADELTDYEGKVSTSGDVLRNLKSKFKNKFVRTLMEYKKQQSVITNLKQYMKYIGQVPQMRNNEGDLIMEIYVGYSKLNTNRFQTSSPSFQNLSREESDIITAPEGFVVFQADSGQIEPRLYYSWTVKDPLMDYLIEQYNDVYYAIADYCLRDSIQYTESNLFITGSITELERNAFKTLTNAGTYGAGTKRVKNKSKEIVYSQFEEENPEEAKIIKNVMKYKNALARENLPADIRNEYSEKYDVAIKLLESLAEKVNLFYTRFTERVINHPQRVEFLRNEELKIFSHSRTFQTVFGDKIQVSGSKNYILNCSINNPLQGAVARLSAMTIVKAFKFIYSKGLEHAINYSLCKHDQDVYTVRADVIKEVEEYLSSLREYEIEGAHKIHSDSSYDLDYGK